MRIGRLADEVNYGVARAGDILGALGVVILALGFIVVVVGSMWTAVAK